MSILPPIFMLLGLNLETELEELRTAPFIFEFDLLDTLHLRFIFIIVSQLHNRAFVIVVSGASFLRADRDPLNLSDPIPWDDLFKTNFELDLQFIIARQADRSMFVLLF